VIPGEYAKIEPAMVVRKLQKCGFWLTTAESCTGGLIARLITSVPGASVVFAGGVVTYANEAKMELLGVAEQTLIKYGAVSRETALEMAHGARGLLAKRMRLERMLGLSVTGIAGPSEGSISKPVGLTWIGIAADAYAEAFRFVWPGDREYNIQASAHAALNILNAYLDQKGGKG